MGIGNKLLAEFDMTSRWNAKDRAEITRFHRELLPDFKKENEEEYNKGFIKSIEILHADRGYSFTDIGTMFGLSQQRISQYFVQHSLRRREGGTLPVWSDKESCFILISEERLEKKLESASEKRHIRLKEEKLEEIKRIHVQAIQNYAKKHKGMPPKVTKLLRILGYETGGGMSSVTRYWGYDQKRPDCSITGRQAIDNLYEAAGFKNRQHVEDTKIPRVKGTIGWNLTEIREGLYLTMREASEVVGLDRNIISRHERNDGNPGNYSLKKYEDGYGVSRKQILTRKAS